MNDAEPQQLPLDLLIEACRDNTTRYSHKNPLIKAQSDGRYCLELWKRACCGDQPAWTAVADSYLNYVETIVWSKYRSDLARQENVEDIRQDAFLRMARYYTCARAAEAVSLGQVLRFLSDCTTSACMDWHDKHVSDAYMDSIDAEEEDDAGGTLERDLPDTSDDADVEGLLLEKEQRRRFWAAFSQICPNPLDALVFHMMFVEGYPPSEILRLRPDMFTSVQDIFERKRKAIDRGKNNTLLQQMADELALKPKPKQKRRSSK